MKKFTKFCGTLIMTLGVVGAVFLSIGIYTVGWDEIGNLT